MEANRIDAVRNEMETRIEAVSHHLGTKIDDVQRDLDAKLRKLFVRLLLAIVVVGGLVVMILLT
jgi:hypothetical protein